MLIISGILKSTKKKHIINGEQISNCIGMILQRRTLFTIITIACLLWVVPAVSAQNPAWQYASDHESISSIDLSADGRVIAVGSTAGSLVVFDGRGASRWGTKTAGELLVDVAPDGSMIVTGSRENIENDKGTVRAYDPKGTVLWLNNTGWVTQLAAAGNPLSIAVGTRHGMALIFNNRGGIVKSYSNFPLLDVVKEIGISPDGKAFAYSLYSEKPTLRLMNITKGGMSLPASFGDHVALSTNGSAIAVAEGEGSLGKLHLYAGNGTCLWTRGTGDVNDVAISGDGTCMVTGEENGNITMYDRNGNVTWVYRAHGPVNSVSMTQNATLVAAGSSDEHVYLVDGTGKLVWEYGDPEVLENPVTIVRLSDRGNALIALVNSRSILYFPVEVSEVPMVSGNATLPAGNRSTVNMSANAMNASSVKGNLSSTNSSMVKGNLSSANSSMVKGNLSSANSSMVKGNLSSANSSMVNLSPDNSTTKNVTTTLNANSGNTTLPATNMSRGVLNTTLKNATTMPMVKGNLTQVAKERVPGRKGSILSGIYFPPIWHSTAGTPAGWTRPVWMIKALGKH